MRAVVIPPSCASLHSNFYNFSAKSKVTQNKDSIFTAKLIRNQRHVRNFSNLSRLASAGSGDYSLPEEAHQQSSNNGEKSKGLWQKWKENSAEMSGKLAKLGLAAVLAYGIFDGVTYTSFFVLAFLGYEKSTGKNPAANLKALLGIVILMWTGNNVTRPFRVAGAAALAPAIDKGLKRIQRYFNFPSLVYAFALVAGIVAIVCFTIAALLILSKWGK